MSIAAPEGAQWAGTRRKATQDQVWYRNVEPGSYEFSYGDVWHKQDGQPICLPLVPVEQALQVMKTQRDGMVYQACQEIQESLKPYNINIDCSAAMRATVEAMIDAGYRK